jgi:hypothetical protein
VVQEKNNEFFKKIVKPLLLRCLAGGVAGVA